MYFPQSNPVIVFFPHVSNTRPRWLVPLQPLLPLVYVSHLHCVYKPMKSVEVGQTFSSPHNQVCAHSFVAICQIEMCGKYWSDEAVGAAGRLKDSVMRH